MKKMITAFALAMVVLAGCGAKETLTTSSFTASLEKTADESVRVYFANPESLSNPLADSSIATYSENEKLAGLKSSIIDLVKGLTLTEDADQNKVYGNPVFFVDLNKVSDDNYERFVVFENMVVVATGDEFKNYTLDDASKEAITNLYNSTIEILTAE